jgi:hypothetical protein
MLVSCVGPSGLINNYLGSEPAIKCLLVHDVLSNNYLCVDLPVLNGPCCSTSDILVYR